MTAPQPDLAAIRARVVRMLAVAAGGAEAAGEAEAGGLTDRAAGMRTKVYERHDAILGAYDELLAEVARLTGELAKARRLANTRLVMVNASADPNMAANYAQVRAERDALRAELAKARQPRSTFRCGSCDHDVSIHQEDGCWFTVDLGRPGRDAVCSCVVPGSDHYKALADAAPPVPAASEPEADRHAYLSTACQHGLRDDCGAAQLARGDTGAPHCKYCPAPCMCPHHTGGECGTLAVAEPEADREVTP